MCARKQCTTQYKVRIVCVYIYTAAILMLLLFLHRTFKKQTESSIEQALATKQSLLLLLYLTSSKCIVHVYTKQFEIERS